MQTRSKFAASVALLAVAAMAVVGVASASAYTVTPEGPFKAVAYTPAFDFYGPKGEVQEEIRCNAEVLEGKVNPAGSSTQFTVTPTFAVCESAKTGSHPNGLGPVTIKQSLGSVFGFSMTPTTATQTGLNLQITRTNYPNCTFNIVGGSNYPYYIKNEAGEIQGFYSASTQTMRVANSVTPTEHCPQLYPNGTTLGFRPNQAYITTHPLTIK